MTARPQRPRARSCSRTRRGELAVLAIEQRAVLFEREICERDGGDCRRHPLRTGKTIVDRLAELQARADAGEIRNRLVRARRRQALRRYARDRDAHRERTEYREDDEPL